jgi:hypothetical protein
MSMREYPASGYVVPIEALKAVIPADKHDEFDTLFEAVLEGDDTEAFLAFLDANWPDGHPAFELYRPSDEDTVDEPMENGHYYAVFDEDTLFTKKLTPEGEKLKALGVTPEFSRWSVWG